MTDERLKYALESVISEIPVPERGADEVLRTLNLLRTILGILELMGPVSAEALLSALIPYKSNNEGGER